MGDLGAKYISSALKVNKTLTDLNLGGNKIGEEGGICLGRSLESNNTLQRLHIGNNYIGAVGAAVIAKALHHNTALTELLMYGTSIFCSISSQWNWKGRCRRDCKAFGSEQDVGNVGHCE
jgi:hypothetical protein